MQNELINAVAGPAVIDAQGFDIQYSTYFPPGCMGFSFVFRIRSCGTVLMARLNTYKNLK
jgi:hypothetical protein